jgi:hypothetical protein
MHPTRRRRSRLPASRVPRRSSGEAPSPYPNTGTKAQFKKVARSPGRRPHVMVLPMQTPVIIAGKRNQAMGYLS